MSQPIPVDIPSDSDSERGGDRWSLRDEAIDLTTPPPFPQSKKKQKTEEFRNPSNSTVFIIDDDDPTPLKEKPPSSSRASSSTPSFVAETPFSDAPVAKSFGGRFSFSGNFVLTLSHCCCENSDFRRNWNVVFELCDSYLLLSASLFPNDSV